jgi:hypothetical protein
MTARLWIAEQVVEMRERYRAGESQASLAVAFGGSRHAVKSACVGDTYSDVPGWLTVAERRARRAPGRRVPPILGDGMWA